MTAQTATAPVSPGTTVTQITGATSGDTVPAGSTILMFNGGAGSHVVTLTNNATNDGLASANRTHTIAAAAYRLAKIPNSYGDANGLVAIAIDGTATEVKYWLIAA
jgi:hypothetical protein